MHDIIGKGSPSAECQRSAERELAQAEEWRVTRVEGERQGRQLTEQPLVLTNDAQVEFHYWSTYWGF